jgi:hypothetical protein
MYWVKIKDRVPPLNKDVLLFSEVKVDGKNIISSKIFREPLRDEDILAYCKGARITDWTIVEGPKKLPHRSKYIRGLMKERDELIEKLGYQTLHLTEKENSRLKEIENELYEDGKIFAYADKDDADASELIRHAVKVMKEKDDHLPCPFIKLQEFGLDIKISKTKVVISYRGNELSGELNHIGEPKTFTLKKRR